MIEKEDTDAVHTHKIQEINPQVGLEEQTAFDIFEELKAMDVTTYTPIEALNKLYEMAKRAKN